MKRLRFQIRYSIHSFLAKVLAWCIVKRYWNLANKVVLLRARLSERLITTSNKKVTEEQMTSIITEKTDNLNLVKTITQKSPEDPQHWKKKFGIR